MTKNHKMFMYGALAVLGLVAVAGASAYMTKTAMTPEEKPQVARVQKARPAPQQHARNVQPPCDDKNIVGTVVGGVAGGVVGNQIGKGSGRTLATVGGAAGGAYLGNEYINTRGVMCN